MKYKKLIADKAISFLYLGLNNQKIYPFTVEKNIKSVILTRLVNFFTCVNDFFSQFARN